MTAWPNRRVPLFDRDTAGCREVPLCYLVQTALHINNISLYTYSKERGKGHVCMCVCVYVPQSGGRRRDETAVPSMCAVVWGWLSAVCQQVHIMPVAVLNPTQSHSLSCAHPEAQQRNQKTKRVSKIKNPNLNKTSTLNSVDANVLLHKKTKAHFLKPLQFWRV